MATNEILEGLIKDPDRLKDLADEAKELALQHGALLRIFENPNSSEVITYTPFTLFPSPVPKAKFLQALALQIHYNLLVDRISQDPGFLEEALASTIQADDFTANLFRLYREVQQEGRTKSIVMGLNRSDYMLDQREDGTCSLKQTEINTIAVGGICISGNLPVVHRRILQMLGLLEESQCVPENNCIAGMTRALARAWELYGQQEAVVMFLVEDVQLHKLGQRCIEHQLWRRGIRVIRRKFEEVSSTGHLNGDKKLFVHSFLTYNSCLVQSWDVRLLMERSLAVKCPDISTHLAGTKKVQQELARPGVLERFFPDQPQVVEQIRATFAGLYSLDMGPEGDQTVAMALANPEKFVLKPQREGGGNNVYGEDIVRVLEEVKGDKRRAAYILMDKIRPKTEQNILLKTGQPLKLTSVCYEIGAFGAYVRQGKDMVMNECVGHLLRTKNSEQFEGGITARVSALDNPLLV
uniref:Glutathione synthetase n=1 Tax=Myripristis murdjan TaxID=586833 RepID=A0A667X2H3_9TELE